MKTMNRAIAILTIAALALAFLACPVLAEGSLTGTWQNSVISFEVITQGKLCHAATAVLTLYEDNTFVLTDIYETSYSSDNGETYNPVSDVAVIVYGTYEVVETDEDLGESVIQFASVTRILRGEEEADEEALSSCGLVGEEVIVSSDTKIDTVPNIRFFIGNGGRPE